MYKHLLLVGLTSLLVANQTTSHAQTRPRQPIKKPVVKTPATPKPDLLVRPDGTQLEVLVTEITDKEIVYRRVNNPGGPIYRAQKADFSSIKYGSNGEVEQFATVAQPAPVQPTPTTVQAVPTSAQAAQTRPTQYASNSTPAPTYQTRQPAESFKWRMGVLVGGQSAGVAIGGEIPEGSVIAGFCGGLMVDSPISRVVTVRSQVLYSQKGSDIGLRLSNGTILSGLNLSYLEVPFDLLYKIPIRNGGILLGGGFYWATLLGATIGTRDFKDALSSSDAGLRFSVWGDLTKSLTMNVRYNYGLMDIGPSGSTMKNHTFGIGVGYYLLKK